MASSTIDTLLHASAPPRATDLARGGDSQGTFAPVLNEALQADRREPGAQPAARDAADFAEDESLEPADAAGSGIEESATACGAAFDEADRGDASADEHDSQPSAADGELTTEDADDESDADAVEISAAAIAAAEAAALAAAEGAPGSIDTEGDVGEGQIVPATTATDAAEEADDTTEKTGPEQTSELPPADADAIEIGEAHTLPSRRLGEAPANLDTLKAAVKAAAEAAQAHKEAHGAGNAASKTARGKSPGAHHEHGEASVDASAANDREEAIDASAAIEDDHADDANAAHAAKQINAATAELSQQADGATTGALTTTQPEGGEVNAADATAAAPVVPPARGDAASSARSGGTLARLSADRSMDAGDSSGDQIDRARFVGRVEGAIRAAQQRDGKIHVRLSPPELGTLRIELTMQHGVLSARLEAETPAARNLLLDNLPALRDRLAQQDVRIDRFDVDVRRDGGGASGEQQQNAQDRQAQDPQWRQAQQRQSRATTTAQSPSPARPKNLTTNTALDVRV